MSDIWPSDLESSDDEFSGGASFSVESLATSLFFSLCGWRSGVLTLASVLAWRHAWVVVTGWKRQITVRTSRGGGIAFV